MTRREARPEGRDVPAGPGTPVEVLPGVWRWADPNGGDRCGTALATPEGLVLVDPPALEDGARRLLEGAAGPVRHVALTRASLISLAQPFGDSGAVVWTPAAPGPLPGGLAVCQLPAGPTEKGPQAGAGAAGQDGGPEEVALFWAPAGDGLLITGDCLPVVGQTPVYREGQAPPPEAYADLIRALLAMDPGTLAPARQAPPAPEVVQATGYAAHVGTPFHRRRAAPVDGPRLLIPQATRVLEETLLGPVVMRRAVPGEASRGAAGDAPWLADPFACIRCGQPTTPAVRTCGGPLIPRLCPDCRGLRRTQPPALRVMACAGGCCTRAGARAVLSAIRQAAAAEGLRESIDVVPVSCLGECGIGPLVGVATAGGEEPAGAAAFRGTRRTRVEQFAETEDEELDADSERVLDRFTALVQPGEAPELVERLAAGLRGQGSGGTEPAAPAPGKGPSRAPGPAPDS